ncbi:MAG: DUF4386 domain-containing protein [Thermoanaerobaculia bacterium]
MRTIQQQARHAGRLYFLLALIAPFGLLYVPGRILVAGDATATGSNLRALGGMVRLGMASELVHQALAIFLLLALYELFKPVHEGWAKLLVCLGALLSVPVMFVNSLNQIAALTLVSGADYLKVFDTAQLDALAYLFLRLHGKGIDVASIFWGLWLFPFGLLVLRSRFIPRLFGYLLLVAGTGYLAAAAANLIVPQWLPVIGPLALPLEMGEVPIIFWLLLRGAKPQPQVAAIA